MQCTAMPVRARKRMRIQRRGSHAAAGESTATAERTEVHRTAEVTAAMVAAEMRVGVAAAMMPATMMAAVTTPMATPMAASMTSATFRDGRSGGK